MYQLQLVAVQQAAKEIPYGEVEAALEEGCEDNLLLDVFGREPLPNCGLPLHLFLWPEQPRTTKAWIFISVIVDRTHAVCGSGMEAASAAISPLGFALDLIV
jgi:hypothetical protein